MAVSCILHHGLRELFASGRTAKIGAQYHENILLILDHLSSVTNLKDCQGVKNFHRLKGKRRKRYSMHVSRNMCIIFEWDSTDITILDFEDYH